MENKPPQHGWHGLARGTKCPHCSRVWTSAREAHCRARLSDGSYCCSHFSSTSSADHHWVGGDHVQVMDGGSVAGLVQRSDGTWTTPFDEEARNRLRSLGGDKA
jgi:hypothetical protein